MDRVKLTDERSPAGEVVFLGPPGVGKGVQARILCAALGFGYLSTGDAIRAEIRGRTAIGRRIEAAIAAGEYADDGTIFEIVAARLDRAEFGLGLVLDGFPRTAAQAERFDRLLEGRSRRVDRVVLLVAPEATILERLRGRLVCTACAASFHRVLRPPSSNDRCDDCGAELERRPEDAPAVHRRRLTLYRDRTAPLASYYGRRGILTEIDGSESIPAVADRVRLALHRHPGKQNHPGRKKGRF